MSHPYWRSLCLAAGIAVPSGPACAATPLTYLTSSGSTSGAILPLTWGVLGIATAVVTIIALLLCGAIWHREGLPPSTPGSNLPVERPPGGLRWVYIGTGISALVLFLSVVWTVRVLAAIARHPANPSVTIEVTGHQWWWQVRYVSTDTARTFTTANEIHIPVGEPVLVRLIGADVIHSFWVPALSGKTDIIPGLTNELWLNASKPGIYRGQCTEYCGIEHARMGLMVVAQPPDAFAQWWRHQLQPPNSATNSQVAKGRSDFIVYCGGCHSVRGTDATGILGPDLSHLMNRTTLASATLPNNDETLLAWITDPQGIKPGNLMQRPNITQDDAFEIRSFLKTLN